MKNLLRFEELAQFALCFVVLFTNDVPWWCYVLLFIGPDIGMIGYLINTKVGAFAYNLLHHKAVALAFVVAGLPGQFEIVNLVQLDMGDPWMNPLVAIGIILYGHASMDRIFGYGLKFNDSFHHTHLGWIGKAVNGV
ncbi:MAG: DUF4260 domain-containing protein [Flavobacteriales bacterium]|nr:DUF4260 domain-containing protein [Flavobacteriales bacterium]